MLKIIEMQRKKTGMLFEFCCIAPIIINKDKKNFKKFSSIGSDIGLSKWKFEKSWEKNKERSKKRKSHFN